MPKKQAQFEVQLYQNGRWSTDETKPDQDQAVASAQKLLSLPRVEGVRVLRSWQSGKTIKEETVFSKMTGNQGGNVNQIQAIDWAPECRDSDDLRGVQARLAINRMMRAYLDRMFLTPTEIMHNARQLRRTLDQDQLISRAVDKAASLQARQNPDGGATKQRREQLHGLGQHLLGRLRSVPEQELPSLTETGPDALARQSRQQKREAAELFLRMAMAAELMKTRNWTEKLDRLVALGQQSQDGEALAALDEFAADCLGSSQLIQDLLGQRPHLAAALMALADLADGSFVPDSRRRDPNEAELDDLRHKLADLLGRGSWPQARTALVDRIQHELDGDNPLVRDDPDKARKVFSGLVQRLCSSSGVLGDSGVAGALIERGAQLANKGAAKGRTHGIDTVLRQLDTPMARLQVLAALAHGLYASEQAQPIAGHVDRQIADIPRLSKAAPDLEAPLERLRVTTAVLRRLDSAEALPDSQRRRWTEKLDQLLAQTVQRDGVLESFDDPHASLRERAFNVLKLCDRNILPEGQALQIARQRVIQHLRRPQFERELIADTADKKEAEGVLRQFYKQLSEAGIG